MQTRFRKSPYGIWVIFVAALAALALSASGYFWTGNGIHGTGGALLVLISSALMTAAAIALLYSPAMPRWLRGTLLVLIAVDIVGTALAAYFLEAYWLDAAMLLAAVGFVMYFASSSSSAALPAGATAAIALALAAAASGAGGHAVAQNGTIEQTERGAPPPAGAAQYQGWYTFNGNIENQKYSQAAQITPQNVGKLAKAWEVHTGDVSDGSGKIPLSDWSATPLFVNDTVYVSTPFYRIFAITPDTGHVKWTYDTHAVLKAETQPDLKTRGVAYWQAAAPQAGQPCQKIVYLGTMEGKLHAVDADTGKACDGFAQNGVLDIDQWDTVNHKWPLSILQPPTVYKDTLFIGWAGKDWANTEAPPGEVFAVDAQSGKLKWTFHALPPDAAKKTGTANVWASMSIDPEHNLLYLPVSSPSPNFYGGNRTEKLPLGIFDSSNCNETEQLSQRIIIIVSGQRSVVSKRKSDLSDHRMLLFDHVEHGIRILYGRRRNHRLGHRFRLVNVGVILGRRQALELEQKVVLVRREREAVVHRDHVLFDQSLDDRVKILHAVDLAVADRVEQRLAFLLALLDVLAGALVGFKDLDRRDAAFAVSGRDETLRHDIAKCLCETRADDTLFVFRIETDDTVDGFGRVDRVKC